MGDDFLLETDVAVDLYHRFAEAQPIIDYHCHLPAARIAADHRFRSITEIWLDGDHYKWRAMRANGVAERYCTGDASDWEKFEAWARTVPDSPSVAPLAPVSMSSPSSPNSWSHASLPCRVSSSIEPMAIQ